jgi:hypothetical protein
MIVSVFFGIHFLLFDAFRKQDCRKNGAHAREHGQHEEEDDECASREEEKQGLDAHFSI